MTSSPHLPPVLRHIRKLMGVNDAKELTDAQLVDRFTGQREEAAFETLLERHAPMVWGVCRRLLNDPADVEDAFQATFLVLTRKAGAIARRELLGHWLYGVAYRISLKARANAALRRAREREAAAMMTTAVASPEVLPDLRPVLDEEVQRLPVKYRVPIVLCYLEGKTNEEAARQLSCPPGTVKTRLAKGRELLRNRLTRRGMALSAAGMAAVLSTNLASAAVPGSLMISAYQAALLGASGKAAAVSASVATLADAAIRTMFWSKLKSVLAVCLIAGIMAGGVGWLGYRGLAALPGDATAEESFSPIALPLDNAAVVIHWDRERADLPRHGDEPRLMVRANGWVSVRDPYGPDEPVQARLSERQLQALLRHAVRENGFFGLDERHLLNLGPRSATTVLYISADGKENTIRCPEPGRYANVSGQAKQLAAIEDRLERLALWALAGGDAGLASALQAANEQLRRQFPEAPSFTADDLMLAVRRAGKAELAFERRQVSTDPFSFIYARIERAGGGEPRVTVKANLAAAAKPLRKTGPLDVAPKPIAVDPTVKYDYDIVYVRSPRKGDDKQILWTEVFAPLRSEPGADLMLLHPDGKEELLVSGANGSITDPFVSFDAEWVYYAKYNDPQTKKPGSDVYKVHVKTKKIVKLTEQVYTPNAGVAVAGKLPPVGVFNLGPCPLPGGKVMFTSNRNGYAPTKGYTPTVLQLFTMDDDGGNVEVIGHLNVNSALHPTILKDGRVMFTSYESQGLRDLRNWSVWTIHPDGTNWGPLYSALGPSGVSALHFMSQISDGSVVVEEYYNLNNQGFGTYYKMAPSAPPGEPYFGSASKRDPRNIGYQGTEYNRIPFSPRGITLLTTFCDAFDRPARSSDPKDPNSPRVGKVTHPSGAPDNHLLTVWSPGPVNSNAGVKKPAIDGGIYLIKSGQPVDEPGQMLLVKNDPNYNEQWPRALVPYKRIHGVDEPARLPTLKNDGKAHKALPEGTPFGLVGTSSMYKRESYPGGSVTPGKVTAGPDGADRSPFKGLGALSYNAAQVNWFIQGADAGRYGNSDVHAVRILVTEPTTDPRNTAHYNRRFWNVANERLRILGEFPVRKFGKDGKQPLDPDGNPDTSFLVKIPGNLAWTFQTLDKNGMVLNMAQTWHQVMPGEVRTDCGGCHAHSQKPTDFQLTLAAKPNYAVWDLTEKTPLLTTKKHDQSGKQWDTENSTGVRWAKGVLNVEYYRDVKPILDRSCIACHTGKSAKPAGNLVLDDDTLMQPQGSLAGLVNGPPEKVPGTFLRLVLDATGRFGHKSPTGRWSHPQNSRYIRLFQSRRSLLAWKIFGKRLDGWSNDDFATEETPGDPNSLVFQGKPFANKPGNERLINLGYQGSIMPPPEAVAGTYEADGKKIKVAPLSDEDKLTLVRWIDLGCPIDLSYDPAKPQAAGINGWTLHDNRPTLTLTYPQAGANPALSRLLIGMTDYYTGLDMDTFQVTADFALDGTAAGDNLAGKFKPVGQGVWELKPTTPITELRQGVLTVSVKNRQGNRTEIKRRFSVGVARR